VNSHLPVKKRLNVRREVARIRRDPLQPILDTLLPERQTGGTRERYEEAYYLYSRAMERMLEQVSTVVRYSKGPYYVRKYGGRYGPGQKKLAEKRRRLSPFLELDVSSCLMHTRILLDRAIGISRVFLKGPQLPSFNSFSDHKKFFIRHPNVLFAHAEYSRYMRDQTSWFDIPIKYVRDKFFVHQGPRHRKLFTIGWEGDDNLTLTFLLANREQKHSDTWISFNPWRMSYDIEEFLNWYGNYAIRNVSSANKRMDGDAVNRASCVALGGRT